MADGYLERLAARTAAVGNVLCVGIDPDPAELPLGFGRGAAAIERFARLLLDAAGPHAAAVKVNLAFFEAFGASGIRALERLRSAVPIDLPFIADAKRGDIGNTAARQAVALLDGLGADAVTLSPYLGRDALEPFLERPDRLVYVLCRTSNSSAAQVQSLVTSIGEGAPVPVWAAVARLASEWDPGGRIGLVVGATAPADLAEVRRIAPGLPFLVPGVGAQGGSPEDVLAGGAATAAPGGGRPGGGLLVNVSRAIARAARAGSRTPAEEDPAALVAAAALDWSRRLPVLP